MDVGQITIDNFEEFQTEAIRLGIRFEDRNFYFDESPEIPGLMAWMLTYGGKYNPYYQPCHKNELTKNYSILIMSSEKSKKSKILIDLFS